MIQYARFHIECTSQNKQDRKLYNELIEKFRPYLYAADMGLYRIPITSDEYGYVKQLASQYMWDWNRIEDRDNYPGLYVDCQDLIETVYSKEDFQQGAAYLINFWYFADAYEDENYKEFCVACCGHQNWKYLHALVQTKPYTLPKKAFRNKKFARLSNRCYGFSKEIVDLLIAHGLAQQEDFWEINTRKGAFVAYQLHPQNVIRGLAEDNQMQLADKCEGCGLECYEYIQGTLYEPYCISERTLGQLKGLNQTAEIMNMMFPDKDKMEKEKPSSLLEPMYVVNKDVYLLLHERYPRMQFIPIFLKK